MSTVPQLKKITTHLKWSEGHTFPNGNYIFFSNEVVIRNMRTSFLKREYLGWLQSVCFYHTAMAHSQMEEALSQNVTQKRGKIARSVKMVKRQSTQRKKEENHNKGILFLEQEESHIPGPHSVKNMWKICLLIRPLLATE